MGKVLTTQEEVMEFVAQQEVQRHEELTTELDGIIAELNVIQERQDDIFGEVVASKDEKEIEVLEAEMEAHFEAVDKRLKRAREIEREIEEFNLLLTA